MRICPHGFHHPIEFGYSWNHSCDGCWCEGEEDFLNYGWNHSTAPKR